MNRYWIPILITAIAVAMWGWQQLPDRQPTPQPEPEVVTPVEPEYDGPLFGLDNTLPGTVQDDDDAAALAALAGAFADAVEADALLVEPKLGNTRQVGEVFSQAVVYMLKRQHVSREYPAATAAIADVIEREVDTHPTEALPLTEERRAKFAEIFRAVAYSLTP